jgi:hypothetical protein
MAVAMMCDASLQASFVLSVEQLLLRGWKDITPQNFFFGL